MKYNLESLFSSMVAHDMDKMTSCLCNDIISTNMASFHQIQDGRQAIFRDFPEILIELFKNCFLSSLISS